MKCTFVQNAISILWATLLQCETDIAFRPAHSNRLRLPHGFGSESSTDRTRLHAWSLLVTSSEQI